ncbi:MAG TPA: hypothetical protein VL137_13930 [Polyangiaceae bacterium]|nr:hypothetical protein [Polyangiaceae bacterium]
MPFFALKPDSSLGMLAFSAAVGLCIGCATAQAATEPSTSPAHVDPNKPKGPSSQHALALQRQLKGKWQSQTDKDGLLAVPMVDAKDWERVRFWAIDHFVGFKYGDDLNALNVVMVFNLSAGEQSNPRTCMRVAEKWGRQRMNDFQIQLGPVSEETARWRKQNILVHRADAQVSIGFGPSKFSVAWAAYPAYEHACLLFAETVPWDGEPALAKAVLDRWSSEGVGRLTPLSSEPPARQ